MSKSTVSKQITNILVTVTGHFSTGLPNDTTKFVLYCASLVER